MPVGAYRSNLRSACAVSPIVRTRGAPDLDEAIGADGTERAWLRGTDRDSVGAGQAASRQKAWPMGVRGRVLAGRVRSALVVSWRNLTAFVRDRPREAVMVLLVLVVFVIGIDARASRSRRIQSRRATVVSLTETAEARGTAQVRALQTLYAETATAGKQVRKPTPEP
jgi:hypothetical protein